MRLLLPGHGHRDLSILLWLAASGSTREGRGLGEEDALQDGGMALSVHGGVEAGRVRRRRRRGVWMRE